jgi:hypothetical protein
MEASERVRVTRWVSTSGGGVGVAGRPHPPLNRGFSAAPRLVLAALDAPLMRNFHNDSLAARFNLKFRGLNTRHVTVCSARRRRNCEAGADRRIRGKR